MVDLRAFYEHFDYKELEERANRLGFPRQLVRLALAAYKAPRLIAQQGKLSAALSANRGVIAGCGLAATWVKVYCIEALDHFKELHPRIRLDAYIDDITLSAVGDSEQEVEEMMVRAAVDLNRMHSSQGQDSSSQQL